MALTPASSDISSSSGQLESDFGFDSPKYCANDLWDDQKRDLDDLDYLPQDNHSDKRSLNSYGNRDTKDSEGATTLQGTAARLGVQDDGRWTFDHTPSSWMQSASKISEYQDWDEGFIMPSEAQTQSFSTDRRHRRARHSKPLEVHSTSKQQSAQDFEQAKAAAAKVEDTRMKHRIRLERQWMKEQQVAKKQWADQLKKKAEQLKAEMTEVMVKHQQEIQCKKEQHERELHSMKILTKFDSHANLEDELKNAWVRVEELLTAIEGVDNGRFVVPSWWEGNDCSEKKVPGANINYHLLAARMSKHLTPEDNCLGW